MDTLGQAKEGQMPAQAEHESSLTSQSQNQAFDGVTQEQSDSAHHLLDQLSPGHDDFQRIWEETDPRKKEKQMNAGHKSRPASHFAQQQGQQQHAMPVHAQHHYQPQHSQQHGQLFPMPQQQVLSSQGQQQHLSQPFQQQQHQSLQYQPHQQPFLQYPYSPQLQSPQQQAQPSGFQAQQGYQQQLLQYQPQSRHAFYSQPAQQPVMHGNLQQLQPSQLLVPQTPLPMVSLVASGRRSRYKYQTEDESSQSGEEEPTEPADREALDDLLDDVLQIEDDNEGEDEPGEDEEMESPGQTELEDVLEPLPQVEEDDEENNVVESPASIQTVSTTNSQQQGQQQQAASTQAASTQAASTQATSAQATATQSTTTETTPAQQLYPSQDPYIRAMYEAFAEVGITEPLLQLEEEQRDRALPAKWKKSKRVLPLGKLPEEILTMIMRQLGPSDFLNCRRVSKDLTYKLSSSQLCRESLVAMLPRSKWGLRLIRYANYKNTRLAVGSASMPLSEEDRQLKEEMEAEDKIFQTQDWMRHLLDAARRQLAIESANYCRKITYEAKGCLTNGKLTFSPVIPWGLPSFTQFHDRYADPPWAFENGVLVYFRPEEEQYVATIVTLGTQVFVPIPFTTKGRIVRRVRMYQGVLAFDWAEERATFKPPGEHVHVHRITVFDLRTKKLDLGEDGFLLDGFQLRFEWNICPEGYTIASEGGDVFFTAHNKTHYAVYACVRGRGTNRRTNTVTETVGVWDMRKTATQTAPRKVRDLNTHDFVLSNVHKPSEGGRPQFLGLFISRDTLSPENSEVGYVFFHLEHRTGDGHYHQVSSIGLPLNTALPIWTDRCSRQCSYDGEDSHEIQLAGAHDSGASESDWPGRAPHWRHTQPPLPSTWMETARMHSSSAQLSLVVRYKKSLTDKVWIEDAFGCSHSGKILRNYRFGSDRWLRTKITSKSKDFEAFRVLFGRFTIFGDETMLVGEGRKGDIQVLIL